MIGDGVTEGASTLIEAGDVPVLASFTRCDGPSAAASFDDRITICVKKNVLRNFLCER
jgi:hypothetical protein